MVTLMRNFQKTIPCVFALLAFLATFAAASSNPVHFTFVDSAHNHEVNIRAQLLDSLAITNLENAPTHYDNAMSVRLFLDGHFTQDFHFDASVMVNNDFTNRYINDNFYNPN